MNGPGANFFHRQALEFVSAARRAIDARKRAAAELLGALRRHIDKQKTAGDGRRGFLRGRFRAGGVLRIGDVSHGPAGYMKTVHEATGSGQRDG